MPALTPSLDGRAGARDERSGPQQRDDRGSQQRDDRGSQQRDGERPSQVRNARSRVSEIQRGRMLRAMAEVAAERGAQNATVAHVVARSGVSRRTFYDLFEDREDCFMAAFEHALERACTRAAAAYHEPGRWQARLRAALAEILAFVQAEPDLGRLLVVESLAAGERAMERRTEIVRVLVAAVRDGGSENRLGRKPSALSAEGLVGAVLAVVHARLIARDPRPLSELVNPLMSMIVLPYLGQAAARREAERPVPQPAALAHAQRRDPLRELDMRLTYRTVRVLVAIAGDPGASNRAVADAAGVVDQGQISKLLLRLQNLGLIENAGEGPAKGEPNAWHLTRKGTEVERTIRTQPAPGEERA